VSATHIRWTVDRMPKDMCSPIIVDGRLYRLARQGVLRCYEMASGKLLYTGRLEGISSTWASPVADPNGRIYFANAGKSFVIQAGPKLKILATSDLGDGGDPTAAVARGRLFLMGKENVFCVGRR
jgi:outer membrane protein assembly factor BamB